MKDEMSREKKENLSRFSDYTETLIKLDTCMVKFADGRPICLYIDDFDGESVAIKPVNGSYDRPLWIPRKSVFQPDDELLLELEVAYRQGDKDKLAMLWEKAQPWKPQTSE